MSKLSRVAVLLGLAIGTTLGGIIGALLALPVVAAYPIVERVWLRESLGKNVWRSTRGSKAKRNEVRVPPRTRGTLSRPSAVQAATV